MQTKTRDTAVAPVRWNKALYPRQLREDIANICTPYRGAREGEIVAIGLTAEVRDHPVVHPTVTIYQMQRPRRANAVEVNDDLRLFAMSWNLLDDLTQAAIAQPLLNILQYFPAMPSLHARMRPVARDGAPEDIYELIFTQDIFMVSKPSLEEELEARSIPLDGEIPRELVEKQVMFYIQTPGSSHEHLARLPDHAATIEALCAQWSFCEPAEITAPRQLPNPYT